MRINVKKLEKVKVLDMPRNTLRLINIQTGEADAMIETSRQINISIEQHMVVVIVNALADGKTQMYTSVSLNTSKDFNIMDLAALFTVHKEQLKKYEHFYDHLDLENLQQQARDRYDVRDAVVKEEERYARKLMAEEVKRIAKENIDAKRPPITAMIPAPKKTAVTEDDAV